MISPAVALMLQSSAGKEFQYSRNLASKMRQVSGVFYFGRELGKWKTDFRKEERL